jgi:hypothetical protein
MAFNRLPCHNPFLGSIIIDISKTAGYGFCLAGPGEVGTTVKPWEGVAICFPPTADGGRYEW